MHNACASIFNNRNQIKSNLLQWAAYDYILTTENSLSRIAVLCFDIHGVVR